MIRWTYNVITVNLKIIRIQAQTVMNGFLTMRMYISCQPLETIGNLQRKGSLSDRRLLMADGYSIVKITRG